MFGWHELSRYHPAVALLGGAVAFLFFCLLGRALLGRDRDPATNAWRTPLEFLAGAALHLRGAALPPPPAWTLTRVEWLAWVPMLWLAAALLVSGMAPQSRADETGYHALVTARVLEQGRLDFPVLPWEATVAPQFIWHHAMVPVFAAAGSAAAGVVATCAAILLALALADAAWRATGSRLRTRAGT